MRFSVIIPAYNVSSYIEHCIQSVLNQVYRDFEIIVVNDGSTDGMTAEIIDRIADDFENISVIHQLNAGLSNARNTGIVKATGDYIIFLDGDDFWESRDFLENLNRSIQKHSNPDCLVTSYARFFESTKEVVNFSKITENSLIYDKLLMVSSGLLIAPAWNKIVRRDLFNEDLLFPEGLYYEDGVWCGALLKRITNTVYLNQPDIMYRQNRYGSITNTINKQKVVDSFKGLSIGMADIEKYNAKNHKALLVYYCQSYISILPYVYPYLQDEFIMSSLKQYRFLLKYLTHLSNKTFAATGLLARLLGIRASAWLLNKVLPFYKR